MPFNDALLVRLVSLLPYRLDLLDENGHNIHTFQPSDRPVRVWEKRKERTVDAVGIGHVKVEDVRSVVSRVPDQIEGVKYIVSMRVMQLLAAEGFDTDDLYVPYGLVKEGGRVKGCTQFIQAVKSC